MTRPTAHSVSGHTQDQSLLPPQLKDHRSHSTTNLVSKTLPPGSFSSELRPTVSRVDHGRIDFSTFDSDQAASTVTTEQRLADYRDKIEKETKIKIGSENLLEALNTKNAKQSRDQRRLVESELNTSNRKIAQLKLDLEAELQRVKESTVSPANRLSFAIPQRSPSNLTLLQGNLEPEELDPESESPSYVLAEILQALETEDMKPDYYVSHANELVGLFKRHPALKYDLAWSIFGLRMQMMLLSDSREVIAAGYRVLRHAITDRKSLQTIRAHHTDFLVILSLVKEAKAMVEREQALKLVRAFLDVKDGVHEVAPSVVRIIVAIAEHPEDRLRSISIMTLAELLIRSPDLVVAAGGIGTLADAMGNGAYQAPETLAAVFLHLLDLPARRGLLRSGFELSLPFAAFTEPPTSSAHEDRMRSSAKVVASLFKSWSGIMTISLHDFLPARSVVSSLLIDAVAVRSIVLELLFDILRIKPPSWSSSFLAGRRLTTYGRVTNLKANDHHKPSSNDPEEISKRMSLIEHFSAVVLTILLRVGLLPALMHAERDAPNLALKRKTTLLIGEVLKLANQLLPSEWSAELQVLPDLFHQATAFGQDERSQAVATVYQVDSVNRTLYRSVGGGPGVKSTRADEFEPIKSAEQPKVQMSANMDEAQFRGLLMECQVLNTVNYTKWRWDLIQPMIEGPLTNSRRLDEAMKATKFVHRLLGFLRPFKYRFSDAKNTKPNQRYVRAGCALVRTLLLTPEGTKYLAENKMVRQIAECLAQFDRMSGITSTTPLFSPERLADTLVGGYFAILGVLCSDQKGLQLMERWKIINMFYHIVELKGRDDLIMALLTNLDYTLDSHPRIILSKAMISGSKDVRIAATRILRKYAIRPLDTSPKSSGSGECAAWAIRLLVTQLYDPEIEVCEIAIKILEEACNDNNSLEYVVKCRPALDHLGEIGAPLLLRFLSTSVGYHYLDGLDYITKEMDDWFLGRNDTYVTLVEASLARALADIPEKAVSMFEETPEPQDFGLVPPHFYRELTRTAEGCELLKSKGHFEEFVATIQDFGMEEEDAETIIKVKGCLWAVGNVGSMELGAPFLEQSDVTQHIIEIAEKSEVLTLRGTAFFVLGLISRSLHGQEILASYHWDGTVRQWGPTHPSSRTQTSPLIALQSNNSTTIPTTTSPQNAEIIKSVIKLGNTVLSNKAAADLNSFKQKKAPGLRSPQLFQKVLVVLSSHRYRLPACRFVLDLFDRGVLRRLVLEEEGSEDDEEEDDGIEMGRG
ncbi:hypothetical protein D6D12_08615 [Aureobasidium pullulans]|uniref:Cytosolic regulator pianissimo n=1 Tax=Aureobasidium pullulans TaxID=5580 RepID=A0AB74JKB1_AURPU|nr:hypothetical protein D6D12_08615 [Aureobasidium pullulans]THX68778.1 hypothetical protein D6D04_10481 [Aureobasidium pullulans]